jgi:L-galactono-1,4-lactone dehydrogenase
VTPGRGTLTLSREDDPRLFKLARVGLGALGVVSEVTLQLGPSHQLLEHTYVTSAQARRPARGIMVDLEVAVDLNATLASGLC